MPAGPFVVAAIMTIVPSPGVVFSILLVLSLLSLACYLVAIWTKHERQRDTSQVVEGNVHPSCSSQ